MESSDSRVETDLRKYKIAREKHVSFMFYNNIGNERHYSFHCTNPKLVEIRETFIDHETFTAFLVFNSVNDILRIILRGSPGMNYNRIGKFLSVLVKAQHLFVEVERHTGSTS